MHEFVTHIALAGNTFHIHTTKATPGVVSTATFCPSPVTGKLDIIETTPPDLPGAIQEEIWRVAEKEWGLFIERHRAEFCTEPQSEGKTPANRPVTGRMPSTAPNQANSPRSLEPRIHTSIKHDAGCYWRVLVETSVHSIEFIAHPDGLVAGDTTILDAADPAVVLQTCAAAARTAWQQFILGVMPGLISRTMYYPWESELLKYNADPAERSCPRVTHHGPEDCDDFDMSDAAVLERAKAGTLEGLINHTAPPDRRDSYDRRCNRRYYLGILEAIGFKSPADLVKTTVRDLELRIEREGCAAFPSDVVSDLHVMMREAGLDFRGDKLK